MRDYSRHCYAAGTVDEDLGFHEFFGEPADPCMAYYNEDKRVCSLCKYGSKRVFFKWEDEYYVWCGYFIEEVNAENYATARCGLHDYY